jgi:hypothetical protein
VDVTIARQEGKLQVSRRGANEGIEGIVVGARRIGQVNLMGCEIEGLVGRVTEQVLEKTLQSAPQIDAADACKEATLPDDGRWDVDDRAAALGCLEYRRGALAEAASGRGMKDEWVSIRDGRGTVSHDRHLLLSFG